MLPANLYCAHVREYKKQKTKEHIKKILNKYLKK